MDDKATYNQVREQILNFERVSKSWGHEKVLKSIHDANKGVADGPTPMEVDRVEGKSKGKGKKGKGKGSWNIPWGAGRGFGGRSGGKAKGKGKKGRGRGNNKGGKSKGKKGKSKDGQKGKAAGHNQCKICFGYGHWSGECPQRMDVNNVQQDTSYTGSPVNNNGASSSSAYPQGQGEQSPVQPRTGTVRRIFHITPSSSYSSSPASPASSRHVRMVEFLDSSDEDMHVRKVTGEEWIILDSGSDVSLLPARFSVDGNTTAGTSLRNCQGGKLKTRGTRYTDLQVRDVEGEEVLLRHEFIVGDVTTGLVSLGQLYQAGWKIDGEGSNELFLIDPQDQIKVPVYFKKKSFAIRAFVRHVEEREDDGDSDVSSFHVRTIVQVFEEMELCDFNTWQMTESGTPYIKNVGNSYVDPRPTWGHYWPFRTALVRRTNTTDSWTLVEMTQRFMDKDEPFGLIDECIFNMDGECEILTILGVEEHGFEEFGDLLDEDEEVDGPLRLPDSQPQEQQPAVPVEQRQDVSQGAVSSEAIQVREPPGLSLQDPLGGEEPAAALADVAFPEIESVELDDGLILTCESPVKDLRAGCRLLGISQAGSKGSRRAMFKVWDVQQLTWQEQNINEKNILHNQHT